MLSFLRKSLSGESDSDKAKSMQSSTVDEMNGNGGITVGQVTECAGPANEVDTEHLDRNSKRFLSGTSDESTSNSSKRRKRKQLNCGQNVSDNSIESTSSRDVDDESTMKNMALPEGMPDWGIKMLEILQGV